MKDKVLVAYFEQKNQKNSKCAVVAEDIFSALNEKQLAPEKFAITPVEMYPEDPANLELVVKTEKEQRHRPELVNHPGHFNDYKVFVVVMPNWYNDAPMAIYSFFDKHDYNDTTIVPVICHAGDGGEKIVESLRKFLPMADVMPGVEVESKEDDAQAVAKVADVVADSMKK